MLLLLATVALVSTALREEGTQGFFPTKSPTFDSTEDLFPTEPPTFFSYTAALKAGADLAPAPVPTAVPTHVHVVADNYTDEHIAKAVADMAVADMGHAADEQAAAVPTDVPTDIQDYAYIPAIQLAEAVADTGHAAVEQAAVLKAAAEADAPAESVLK